MKILLTVSYDGTAYCGWQRQENGVTVQQVLEYALSKLYARQITILGASRTDAGVHALGQRAVFSLCNNDFKIPLDKLPCAVNSALPDDIAVSCAEEASEDFHPIYCAKAKTYEYRIYNSVFMNPLVRNYYFQIRHKLDFDAMRQACESFIGEHDFAGFCSVKSKVKTTIRTIHNLSLSRDGDEIIITINGNGFLYNMVRIVVGTLIAVGEGKINQADIPAIIASKRRKSAGKTAPPHGLSLLSVEY